MRVVPLLTLLAACGFHPTGAGDDTTSDGPGADAIDAPGVCSSASPWIDTCALDDPATALVLDMPGAYRYDTDAGTLTTPGGTVLEHASFVHPGAEGDVRVILAISLTVTAGSQLRGVGSLPLAIVTKGGELIVTGLIDVARGGAGARYRPECGDFAGQPGGANAGGGGGGGGAGFGGAGGAGGVGNSDGASQGAPGVGGQVAPVPLGPLGGCHAGPGGEGEDTAGDGGEGGGAVHLVSTVAVRMRGVIDAGGEGGNGGNDDGSITGNGDAGAGGGGSGGLIAIDAPIITMTGILVANGGGGGEGSGDGDAGNDGENGLRSVDAAPGGSGGSPTGSDGAVGSSLATPTGASVSASEQGGAGGGGGGAGYIFIRSPSITNTGVISPSPQP